MLNTIKKIFSKNQKFRGTLTVQNEENFNATMTICNAELQITDIISPTTIPFNSITDLELKDRLLSFICNSEKFVFESDDSSVIYERIKSYTSEKSIFGCKKLEYFIYNTDERSFNLYEKPVTLKIIYDNKYYLRIEDPSAVIHLEEIKTSTQYYMDQQNNSFVWSVFTDSLFHTFCIKFADKIEFLEFLTKYVESSYKSVNSDQEEHKFFENMVKFNMNPQEPVITSENDADTDEYDWREYDEPDKSKAADDAANEHLIVGKEKVFVTRGSSLGIFNATADDVVFQSSIQNAFKDPSKIITHNQDQNLLVLDDNERDKLQLMDLNRGEVIEKWDIDNEMNDYFDSFKFSNDSTLIGLSDYSLFRIDPRLKEKIAEKNEYKTKNEFSCGVTTESGDVAVASKKGDLRLYNKINIRAKSLLPGFGDEIIGIDTCKDGSVILCTCKNYILVYLATSDYSKRLGKDKPTPKRLQLKPQHLSLINEEVSFTPAKFDRDDRLIITSTGRFVVKWKVEDVLAGCVYNYSLKALYDTIVDEKFTFNGNDIVVALPNDVKKVTEADLRQPK